MLLWYSQSFSFEILNCSNDNKQKGDSNKGNSDGDTKNAVLRVYCFCLDSFKVT